MKPWLKISLIIGAAMTFLGADWQTEIAWVNLHNGWEFGWPFSILWPSNWVALDFFRLLRYLIVAALATLALRNEVK